MQDTCAHTADGPIGWKNLCGHFCHRPCHRYRHHHHRRYRQHRHRYSHHRHHHHYHWWWIIVFFNISISWLKCPLYGNHHCTLCNEKCRHHNRQSSDHHQNDLHHHHFVFRCRLSCGVLIKLCKWNLIEQSFHQVQTKPTNISNQHHHHICFRLWPTELYSIIHKQSFRLETKGPPPLLNFIPPRFYLFRLPPVPNFIRQEKISLSFFLK